MLDTWFSSGLWPHSTLGWPEQTPELTYFYPTSVLITSRDIITLWVARMVLTGLNNMGEVPFHEVFIHPKILDGYGEAMSKSKGNGVDPLDVIEKFGADALRFGLAYLTTETQDVRMPVRVRVPALRDADRADQGEPRAAADQVPASAARSSPRNGPRSRADKALPRGPVVSERFELARNFCNKLWNASRFALMNLEGYTPGPVADAELLVEDRWILSRLATVTAAGDRGPGRLSLRRRGPGAVRVRLGRVLQLLRRDGQGPAAGRRASGRRPSGCWPTRSTRCCGCCTR